jgi:opacity protein-like surface antigen
VSRLRIVSVALALAAAGAARADGYLESRYSLTRFLSLDWEPAMPMAGFEGGTGGLDGFVEDSTLRGIQFDIRWGVARHLSLGIATSWHWFAQNYDSKTVQLDGATVTAAVYERVQLATLRATLHWYLTDGPVQPYLGFGVGGAYYDSQIAVTDLTEPESGFALAGDPEIGLLWTIGPGLAVQVLARYQYTTASFAGVENAQYLVVGIGLAAY